MAIGVRGTRIQYVNNANSAVLTLPAGSTAGDLCIVSTGHGFAVNSIPSGWERIDNSTGTNVAGSTYQKVLSSAEITAGSVTFGYAGTYYGTIAAITFVGPLGGYRVIAVSRNSTGAVSRTVTTATAAIIGDYAIYYAHGRANVTVNTTAGGALQTTSNANASGVLRGGILGSAGVVSATFTYSSAPTGDYNVVLVIAEVASAAARVNTHAVEVLSDGPSDAEVTTYGIEVLNDGDAVPRVFEFAIEVLSDVVDFPYSRVNTYGVEVLSSANEAQAFTYAIEVLASVDSAPPASDDEQMLCILW